MLLCVWLFWTALPSLLGQYETKNQISLTSHALAYLGYRSQRGKLLLRVLHNLRNGNEMSNFSDVSGNEMSILNRNENVKESVNKLMTCQEEWNLFSQYEWECLFSIEMRMSMRMSMSQWDVNGNKMSILWQSGGLTSYDEMETWGAGVRAWKRTNI